MDNKRPGGEMKSNASGPTKSQLLPFGGVWQELVTKPYFIPGVLAAAAMAAMWATIGDRSMTLPATYRGLPVRLPMYYVIIALMIVCGGAFAIYRMVGKQKAWWLMPLVGVFTAVLTASPIMGTLQQLFGLVEPAGSDGKNAGPAILFVYYLFAAGFPEEALKAIPVAVGVAIGAKLMGRFNSGHPARQLAVLEPLDGILIGAAAGFGFAFTETLFMYVPKVMVMNSQVAGGMLGLLKTLGLKASFPANPGLYDVITICYISVAKAIGPDRAAFEFQRIVAMHQSAGLELLLPRLIGGIFGHTAYAGIFGYFIGLAAMHPAQRWKTIGLGFLLAASVHAAWNALGGSSTLLAFLVKLAAFAGLAVVIIKARAISPERSQLYGSQLLDRHLLDRHAPARPVGQPLGQPMPETQPPQAAAPTAPTATTPVAAAAPAPMAIPGGTMGATTAAKSITWDDDTNLRLIEIGSARVPASVGTRIYERQAPGAHASRGDGVVAEITANPNDLTVLGLKNLSDQAWHIVTAGGQTRELQPGRSIKLEAGMTLQIGDLLARVR